MTSLGINDATTNRGIRGFLADQNSIFDLLRTKFGASLIVISGLPPVDRFPSLPQPLRWYLGAQTRRFDVALESLVRQQTLCQYLKLSGNFDPTQMASDGFHPGAEHYAAWAETVARIINDKFAEKES